MLKRIILWTAIPLLAAVALIVEAPMALGKTITIFSEFQGRLVNADGAPQSGIKIERWWRRGPDGDAQTDEVTTGADGSFQFPAVTDTSLLAGILPGTPSIKQKVTAQGPDGPVEIWFNAKNSFDANSEFGGKPAKLVCYLDKEPDAEGPAFGTCRIEN